jgi:hypothetical protein
LQLIFTSNNYRDHNLYSINIEKTCEGAEKAISWYNNKMETGTLVLSEKAKPLIPLRYVCPLEERVPGTSDDESALYHLEDQEGALKLETIRTLDLPRGSRLTIHPNALILRDGQTRFGVLDIKKLEQLNEIAGEKDIVICLENLPTEHYSINGNELILPNTIWDPLEMNALLGEFNLSNLGITLDICHLLMAIKQNPKYFEVMYRDQPNTKNTVELVRFIINSLEGFENNGKLGVIHLSDLSRLFNIMSPEYIGKPRESMLSRMYYAGFRKALAEHFGLPLGLVGIKNLANMLHSIHPKVPIVLETLPPWTRIAYRNTKEAIVGKKQSTLL